MGILDLENVSKTYAGQENPAVCDFSLSLQDDEIMTLLGPSGCGKTTVLRMIAGFIKPEQGRISINGDLVAGDGKMQPPEKRSVGMMFQDYALFPHLTVEENIVFGLEKELSRKERKRRVENLLEMVGLSGAEEKHPHQLSGGQKQRIALSRALSREPAVVLMDEPFSSLDERMREGMRREIKSILKKSETPAIIVSHDREDAFSLSDRLAVMRDGRIEQSGTPREIFARPKNRFVADFASRSNLVQLSGLENQENGKVRGHCPLGEVSPLPKSCITDDIDCGTSLLAIRPDAFELDPRGEIRARIDDYIYYGSYVEAMLEVETACDKINLRAHFDQIPGGRGEEINLSFKPESCWVITEEDNRCPPEQIEEQTANYSRRERSHSMS